MERIASNRFGRTTLVGLAAAAALAMSGTARALPCAGFADVEDTSPFCANVEWLKNRAITLGCTATAYCPDAAVSRLAMAAFMHRLGTALTPVQLRYDGTPGAIDLDAQIVACQTPDFTAASYPRRAFADMSLSATAPADTVFAADLVMRVNGGAWAAMNGVNNRGYVPANLWGALADIGHADIAAGDTVRFGVLLDRAGLPGATDLSDSRCQVRVLVFSRNGASSPF